MAVIVRDGIAQESTEIARGGEPRPATIGSFAGYVNRIAVLAEMGFPRAVAGWPSRSRWCTPSRVEGIVTSGSV